MWVAVGIVFAIVAGTVSITLAITSSQISGLERSQAQQSENLLAIISGLEKSQAQQAENLLAITSSQISGLERSLAQLERSQSQQAENLLALMNAQNESVLGQLRLLNDKMTNIETEHAELRSLYETVGVLQTEVAYIRRDLNTMRSDLDRVLEILETSDGN